MTKEEKIERLFQKYEMVTEHIRTKGSPYDFSLQLPFTPVSFDPDTLSMVCYFDIDEKFGTANNTIHSGIITTIIDIAQGATVAVFVEGDYYMTTASLQISHIQPVYTGIRLYVRVKISRITSTMAFCTTEAWQTEGNYTTSSSSIYHLGRDRKS